MGNTSHELNLARKLRPKTFNEIVGQDLSVRILKNSLYLNKFFPAYIFSGQRGCGKTSSARIFAAAINCERLVDFQKDPRSISLPCMQCESCMSMNSLNHPDFIEIDAASHTGVDNVRQILDSAVHSPLVGSKKVYLIDEAHMLSRAAFNAFLKMLEEPPDSVLFILATTEIQKIPDTVRSRAFQVFFESINFKDLKAHLFNICEAENIDIDSEALDLILQEGDGSARDSINLLERVRLASEKVTQETVLQMLGKIGYSKLFGLFDLLLSGQPTKVISYLCEIDFEKRDAQGIWNMLVLLCRYLLWLKYDIVDLPGLWGQNIEKLKDLSKKCSLGRLNWIMQLFWAQESIFLRSSQKHLFLETILLQICEYENVNSGNHHPGKKKVEFIRPDVSSDGYDKLGLGVTKTAEVVKGSTPVQPDKQVKESSDFKKASADISIKNTSQEEKSKDTIPLWRSFLEKVEKLEDPILASIFKQAKFLGLDAASKGINIVLQNNSSFLRDKVKDSYNILRPIIDDVFVDGVGFFFKFNNPISNEGGLDAASLEGVKKKINNSTSELKSSSKPESSNSVKFKKPTPPKQGFEGKVYIQRNRSAGGAQKRPIGPVGQDIDVSNAQEWPVANLIAKQFSGKIEKIGSDS